MPDPQRQSSTSQDDVDEQFRALMEGLRTTIPGVMTLFAFLLILPFQNRYAEVTAFQEKIYFGTLICTSIATVCLIAPPVRHRLLFRQGVKDWILFDSNRVVQVGFGFLAVAIVGVIFLIGDFIYDSAAGGLAAAGIAVVLVWLWFGSPLVERRRGGRGS